MTVAAMVGPLGADITCLKMPKPWLLLGSTAPPALFLPHNFPIVDLIEGFSLRFTYMVIPWAFASCTTVSVFFWIVTTQSSLQKFC
jgi:hypothetical protein